jgi:hypothetical protein
MLAPGRKTGVWRGAGLCGALADRAVAVGRVGPAKPRQPAPRCRIYRYHGDTRNATAAAGRMERSRSRRGKGLRCYMLEFRDTEIVALGRRGLLAPGDQTDRAAVIKAMYASLDCTLGRSV